MCSVGALRPPKGFDFVIKSLALLPADKRPALVLACNEENVPERVYLEHLASQLGVKLEIRVRISDDELVQLYNQALLTLYAPVMEPFGFIPLESMACGTAVVGVNEAGVRESVVSGVTGLLVEREPALFAATILDLLSNPTQRNIYGLKGREIVLQNWTWEKAVKTLEDYLTE